MRYFVVGQDGNQYGPADQFTLQEWVGQGRIQPDTVLIEEGTGRRIIASAVPGLIATQIPPSQPQANSYQQPYNEYSGQGYSRPTQSLDTNPALIKAIIVLCCCCQPLGIVAVVYAAMASSSARTQPDLARDQMKKSDTWANWGIGLGIGGTLIYILFFVLTIGFGGGR
jgi:hypothetical protein